MAAIGMLLRQQPASPVKSYEWTTSVMVDPMTDIETKLIARKSEAVDAYMVQPEHAMISISIEEGKVVCASVSLSHIDPTACLNVVLTINQPRPSTMYGLGRCS